MCMCFMCVFKNSGLFACLFFKDNEEAWGCIGVEDLGGSGVEESVIRIYCMKKYCLFLCFLLIL